MIGLKANLLTKTNLILLEPLTSSTRFSSALPVSTYLRIRRPHSSNTSHHRPSYGHILKDMSGPTTSHIQAPSYLRVEGNVTELLARVGFVSVDESLFRSGSRRDEAVDEASGVLRDAAAIDLHGQYVATIPAEEEG